MRQTFPRTAAAGVIVAVFTMAQAAEANSSLAMADDPTTSAQWVPLRLQPSRWVPFLRDNRIAFADTVSDSTTILDSIEDVEFVSIDRPDRIDRAGSRTIFSPKALGNLSTVLVGKEGNLLRFAVLQNEAYSGTISLDVVNFSSAWLSIYDVEGNLIGGGLVEAQSKPRLNGPAPASSRSMQPLPFDPPGKERAIFCFTPVTAILCAAVITGSAIIAAASGTGGSGCMVNASLNCAGGDCDPLVSSFPCTNGPVQCCADERSVLTALCTSQGGTAGSYTCSCL